MVGVGEIDTTPIEPVQNAVSFFGDIGDHKKFPPTRSKRDYEKEIEDLKKELANYKVQLEAKHAAHMQALLKPEQNQKMIHELSALLKNSDIERNKYTIECSEGRASKDELESKMKEISDMKLETAKVKDQLSHVLSELKATQKELLNKDTEIFAAKDSEMDALTKTEQLENELKMEKGQKKELLFQVQELSELIHRSKLAAIKAEKVKIGMLSERDGKIQLATIDTAQAQQELEDMRKHIDMILELQNKQMNYEALISSEDFVPNALNIDNIELNQLTNELASAKEEINGMNVINESLTSELEKFKAELKMSKERDIETQVEIALLKSELEVQKLAYKNGYVTDEERNSEKNNERIKIPLKEYTYLVREAEKANEKGNQLSELVVMKKELENASAKISELRARAEQAVSRAELAENAKTALEEKIRRHREHRQRRKAALTALREESTPKPFTPSTSYGTPGIYQPLGKVLNMKL